MDYPISVPSIGLVGGKFVDEDPLSGTPGSLIPSQWGNAVTDEILHVIETGGLVPDEEVNTQLATAIAAIAGAARPIASQAEAEGGTDNTKVMTSLRTLQAIIKHLPSHAPVTGAIHNLRCLITAASTTASFTVDQLTVQVSLLGASYRLASFSKSINLATVGAGGMDIGVAPVNGYVAIYAIYNPSSGVSALLGVNATATVAPEVCAGVMPGGYTASALLTVLPTNASGQFAPGSFVQGDHVWIPNNTFYTSSTQQATLFARDLSLVVPLNAKSADFSTTIGTTAATVTVSNAMAGSLQVVGSTGIGEKNCAATSAAIAGAGFPSQLPNIPIITPQTAYYKCSVATGTMSFSIACSGYSIR